MAIDMFDIGIDDIDVILGGGLPSGSITALVGEPGSGKIDLSLRFISRGFEKNEPGLFISFTTVPLANYLRGVIRNHSFKALFETDDPIFLKTMDLQGVDRILGLIEDGAVKRLVLDRPEVLGMRELDHWFSGLENVLTKAREMGMATLVIGGSNYIDLGDHTSEGILEMSRGPDGKRTIKMIKWPFKRGGVVSESEVGEWIG